MAEGAGSPGSGDVSRPGQLAGLASEVAGSLLLPDDDRYPAACRLFNLNLQLTPTAVLEAEGTADVQAAIRFAAAREQAVAVMMSGHQVIPQPHDTMLITTHRMNRVCIDPEARSARVEAGAAWRDVIAAAAPYGLAPIAGSAPHVGATGYTLGGGQSPTLGRSLGYAADHVNAIEMVTADGEFRRVTAQSEPELFWAARGCKGNFGLVTALEFDLFPVRRLYGGGIYFPGEHLADLLHAWRGWAPALPEQATSSIAVQRLPAAPELPEPLRGAFVVHLRFSHLGSAQEGERLLAPMRGLAPAVLDTVGEMAFTATASIHNDPVDPLPYRDRSTSLRELPAEAVDAFVAATGPGSRCSLASVEIRHLEGALGREPAVANAVSTREVPFVAFGYGVTGPEGSARAQEELAAFVDALRPWASGRLMANFLSADEATTPESVRDVFGGDRYDRLARIKREYDPSNMFRINHNVPAARP